MANDAGNEQATGTTPKYADKFDDVFAAEFALVSKRWRGLKEHNLSGLALSGGGIRSAAFSLGAVQQLHHCGALKQIHYLSTVSGGGYCGASLTWFLAMEGPDGAPCFDLSRDNFPFTGGEAAGLRRNSGLQGPACPAGELGGRPIVDFIRQRSSYLLPGAGMDLVSAFAIVLRSVVISLFGYLLLMSLFALLILWVGMPTWAIAGLPAAFVLSGAVIVLLLASMIVYSIVAPAPRLDKIGYGFRHYYQRWAGTALRSAAGIAVFGIWLLVAVPEESSAFAALRRQFIDVIEGLLMSPQAAAGAGGAGALGGLLTRALVNARQSLGARFTLAVVPPLALVLLVFALGIGGLIIAKTVLDLENAGWWIALLVVFFLLYALYANINLTGLHRFYRDRLMETFMPTLDDVREDRRITTTGADEAALAAMYPQGHQGPYHLINTNLVLLDGALARYRSRGSDSFVLAPLYCGSESTGFVRTADWTPGPIRTGWRPRFSWFIRPVGPLTLPTAMAISAAAVNPRTGADGQGMTRRASVSTLLTILNLRLGCWLPSPQIERYPPWLATFYPPNFFIPGLSQGLLGFGRDENSTWVELTDGGHFDNTGLYELVRRRVKTIFFVDGTEDPETSFASFANAVEKIYIDFNVKIRFGPDNSFTRLMVDADVSNTPLARRFRLAEDGVAVAELIYPAEKDKRRLKGTLYYIKATMTPGLPPALYSYKADNSAFPWEPTTDQFFTEKQFEAYRALGFALAKRLSEQRANRPPPPPRPAP
jgi:hypothetical protein